MCGICGFCDFTRDNAGPVWREAGERMGETLAHGDRMERDSGRERTASWSTDAWRSSTRSGGSSLWPGCGTAWNMC